MTEDDPKRPPPERVFAIVDQVTGGSEEKLIPRLIGHDPWAPVQAPRWLSASMALALESVDSFEPTLSASTKPQCVVLIEARYGGKPTFHTLSPSIRRLVAKDGRIYGAEQDLNVRLWL